MYEDWTTVEAAVTRRSRAFLAAAYITLVGSHALALEKSDVELLRKAVVRGVEGGEVKSAYITFGGAPARVRVKAADAQGLTIVMSGARIPLSWDKVEARYLAGMASKAAASASEWWALGELYGEIGKPEEADKAHRKAAGLDGDYRKKLDAMLAASRSKATPARPRVALGTSRRAKTPSVKETDLKFPPWKGPTPERKLRTDRPRLLITPERSRYLRSSGRSLPSYGAMKPYCRSHPTSDYYAPMQALVYLVEGDEVFGRMAIDNVKRNAVRRGVDRNLNSCFPKLGRTALVYDWCYPLLSDADKDAFRKWMVSQYDAMAKTYSGEHYHNYHSAAAYAFGLAGYALHGDDPKAAEMIRYGVRERFENGII